jgi:centromeric protein E
LNAQKKEVEDTDALIERYRKEIEDLKARLAEREREVMDVGRRGSIGVKRRLSVREVGLFIALHSAPCLMG